MAHEVEQAYYGGNRPAWHGIGKVIADGLTTTQAMIEAGLDWHVALQPVEYKGKRVDDELSDIDKARWYLSVRESDDSVLGLVGPRYEPIQNADVFDLGDALVGSGDAHWNSAGSLKVGRWCFANLQVNEDLTVVGDTFRQYLNFMWSHDGSAALTILPSDMRVECANMFRYKMAAAKYAGQVYRVRHTASSEAKVGEARNALGLTLKAGEELKVEAERLAMVKVDMPSFAELMQHVVPEPAAPKDGDEKDLARYTKELGRVADQHRLYQQVWQDSPNLENIRGTAWGAVNAIIEADDHHTQLSNRGAVPKRERRFLSVMDGHPTSQRAFKYYEGEVANANSILVNV